MITGILIRVGQALGVVLSVYAPQQKSGVQWSLQ